MCVSAFLMHRLIWLTGLPQVYSLELSCPFKVMGLIPNNFYRISIRGTKNVEAEAIEAKHVEVKAVNVRPDQLRT